LLYKSSLNNLFFGDQRVIENPPAFEEDDHLRDDKRFTAGALRAVKPGLEKIKARFGISTEELAAIALNYVLSFPNVGGRKSRAQDVRVRFYPVLRNWRNATNAHRAQSDGPDFLNQGSGLIPMPTKFRQEAPGIPVASKRLIEVPPDRGSAVVFF